MEIVVCPECGAETDYGEPERPRSDQNAIPCANCGEVLVLE
ncbi:hypothetical protein [Halococcus sp. IIIV-5B]|nr:hypothetical protein [Halococcus sp. IIIV-5B]